MLVLGKLTCWYHPWENFRRAFSLDPTDCPWVSEDGRYKRGHEIQTSRYNESGVFIVSRPITAKIKTRDRP